VDRDVVKAAVQYARQISPSLAGRRTSEMMVKDAAKASILEESMC